MPEVNRKKELLKILSTLDPDRISKEDFVNSFENIVDIILKIEEKLQKESSTAIDSLKELQEELSIKLKGNNKTDFSDLKRQIDIAISDVKKALKDQADGMNFMRDKVRDLKDGEDADSKEIVKEVLNLIKLPEQKEVILDGGEEIVNKLETLEGNVRLDVSAIKGLQELLDKSLKGLKGTFGTGGGNVREIWKEFDLSDQLDGSTKTFLLPAFYKIISVSASSSPGALRPTIDYTFDSSDMSITFTDQIGAASTLATGQTLLIVYSEA